MLTSGSRDSISLSLSRASTPRLCGSQVAFSAAMRPPCRDIGGARCGPVGPRYCCTADTGVAGVPSTTDNDDRDHVDAHDDSAPPSIAPCCTTCHQRRTAALHRLRRRVPFISRFLRGLCERLQLGRRRLGICANTQRARARARIEWARGGSPGHPQAQPTARGSGTERHRTSERSCTCGVAFGARLGGTISPCRSCLAVAREHRRLHHAPHGLVRSRDCGNTPHVQGR
jgi:hypothetical protein